MQIASEETSDGAGAPPTLRDVRLSRLLHMFDVAAACISNEVRHLLLPQSSCDVMNRIIIGGAEHAHAPYLSHRCCQLQSGKMMAAHAHAQCCPYDDCTLRCILPKHRGKVTCHTLPAHHVLGESDKSAKYCFAVLQLSVLTFVPVMLSTSLYSKQALQLSPHNVAVQMLKPCSQVQVGTRGPGHYVQCRRIMSDLLPAAELLLRGVMDQRHALWHKNDLQPSGRTAQHAVQEARCTATWLRLKGAR